MKTIALIAALAAPAAVLTVGPVENNKFPPERHAALAALTAAD